MLWGVSQRDPTTVDIRCRKKCSVYTNLEEEISGGIFSLGTEWETDDIAEYFLWMLASNGIGLRSPSTIENLTLKRESTNR